MSELPGGGGAGDERGFEPPRLEPQQRSRANTWPLRPRDDYAEDGQQPSAPTQQQPRLDELPEAGGWELQQPQQGYHQQPAAAGVMIPPALNGALSGAACNGVLSGAGGGMSSCNGASLSPGAAALSCSGAALAATGRPGAAAGALHANALNGNGLNGNGLNGGNGGLTAAGGSGLMMCKSEPGTSSAGDNKTTTTGGADSSGVLPKPKNSNRRNAWGPHSYADLITQAISSSPEKRLTLAQVYEWMVTNIPWFKDKGDSTSSAGWKNSIRHNLSLHSRFVKVQNEGTGKSSWWMLNPDAKTGKCTRRRATLETSKYEKKRGRAKKKMDALRNGLEHAPSPASSLVDGLEARYPESPLHPAHPAHPAQQGYAGDYRPRPAAACGRLSPSLAWPYRHAHRRLDGFPPEAPLPEPPPLPEPGVKFEPLAYRGLAGYGVYAGAFSPGGHQAGPPGVLGGPGPTGPDPDRGGPPPPPPPPGFSAMQSVSPAASGSSLSPSQSAVSDHYAAPHAADAGLYGGLPTSSAAGGYVASPSSYHSPVSSSYTPSPSGHFSAGSPGGGYGAGFSAAAAFAPPPLPPHLAQFGGSGSGSAESGAAEPGVGPAAAALSAASGAAMRAAAAAAARQQEEPQTPSQLMSNLMGALQQNHMPVDLDLEQFQGGFDCDVDNIIKQELTIEGHLDFQFSQGRAAAGGAALHVRPGHAALEARHLAAAAAAGGVHYVNTGAGHRPWQPHQHPHPHLNAASMVD